jgi:hypothetical protein
MIIPD